MFADDHAGVDRFLHADEEVASGYHRVRLRRSAIVIEPTASERAGMMRFTFPASDSACLLADLRHVLRWDVLRSQLRVENDSTLTGMHVVAGWAKNRTLDFAASFSRPFAGYTLFKDFKRVQYDGYRFRSAAEAAGANLQFVARWKTNAAEAITMRIAVSSVSTANALANLDQDASGRVFAAMRHATEAAWDRALATLEVTATERGLRTFYTALYHAMLAPALYTDTDGSCRGLDQSPHHATGFTAYTTFSLRGHLSRGAPPARAHRCAARCRHDQLAARTR